MNQYHHIKIMAASLCAVVSMQTSAGLGNLQVQSSLGEPFSGSIVATGDEARALLNNSAPKVIGASLRASAVRQGENQVLIRLRSSLPIHEPLLNFSLSIGGQGRQYSAIIDPPEYRVPAVAPKPAVVPPVSNADARREAARAAVATALVQEPAAVEDRVAAPAVTGQRYALRPQENLIDVARKVQPQGLSLAQTMRALVRANPRAFRQGNPDLMYKNVTLNIPSAAAMRRLAKQVAPAMPRPVPETVVASTAVATPAVSDTVPMPASEPVLVAAASAVVPAVAESVEAASAVAASAPVAVSAPVVAAAVVSAPTSEQMPAAEPMPVEADGLGDWLPYLLGASGVGMLLLLTWWLRRRRAAAEAAPAVEALVLAGGQPYAVSDEDEDDVVFVDVDQTVQSAPSAPDNVVDTGMAVPAATVATAEQANTEEDWSWLADADKPLAADAATPASAKLDESVLAQPQAVPVTAEPAMVADDDGEWLNFDRADVKPATLTQPPVAPVMAEAAVVADDEGWLDFSHNTDVKPAATIVTATAAVATTAADEWVAEDVAATTMAPAETVLDHGMSAAPLSEDFSWLTHEADAGTTAPETREAVVDSGDATLEWDVPLVDKPRVDDSAVVKPDQAAVATDVLAWDDILTVAAEEPAHQHKGIEPAADAQQRHAFAAAEQDLAVADINWAELGLVEEAPTEASVVPEAVVPLDMETSSEAEVKMDTVATPVAPNLSVPLEAKLELAKMYLEIDDAQTARKTLQELLTEADGDILAEVQSLLRQLGN